MSKTCKVYWKSGAVELHEAQPQGYLNVGTISFYIDEHGVHFEVGKLDKLLETGDAGWERDKHNIIVSPEMLDEVEYITLEGEVMYPLAERLPYPADNVITAHVWHENKAS